MPLDHLQITARNRPRVMAEITSLLAHRRVDVIAAAFTRPESGYLHAELTIEIGDSHQRELLQRRLCRLVDVLNVSVRQPLTSGENAPRPIPETAPATGRQRPDRTNGMGPRPPPRCAERDSCPPRRIICKSRTSLPSSTFNPMN